MTKRRTPTLNFPIVRHAPGLEETQGLPNGGMDFWAAGSYVPKRTYRDENDGWNTIRSKKKKAKKQPRTA